MTKLIAVHSLILASDVKGVVDQIEPGKAFTAREDELSLIERGAARKPHASEKDLPLTTRASKGAAAPSAPAGDDEGVKDTGQGNGEGQVELNLADMTKADLIAFAAAENIEVDNSANKPVILEAIQAALLARKEDDLV